MHNPIFTGIHPLPYNKDLELSDCELIRDGPLWKYLDKLAQSDESLQQYCEKHGPYLHSSCSLGKSLIVVEEEEKQKTVENVVIEEIVSIDDLLPNNSN